MKTNKTGILYLKMGARNRGGKAGNSKNSKITDLGWIDGGDIKNH